MKLTYLTGVTLALAAHVTAWGPIGHQAVGYIAMEFLAPNAAHFVKQTIPDSYNNNLGAAATWPDDVRKTPEYKWSAPFHFIDTADDPKGGACFVEEPKCGRQGCLLSAIANYTQRVNDFSLDETQNMQALYFITHFLGDIGQPLHIEGLGFGGNLIRAKCNGQTTNLHATWDVGMMVTMLNSTYDGDMHSWVSTLVEDIKTGSYESKTAGWLSCSSTTKSLSQRRTIMDDVQTVMDLHQSPVAASGLACPLVWARESNAYDCSNVFKFSEGEDLCQGTYYTTNIPVINEQIAKQGYRLAAWLNVIFDGSTHLP